MGIKIFCLGVTMTFAAYLLNFSHEVQMAGAILMIIGNVLMVLNQ